MANSNKVQIAIAKEAQYGVNPGGAFTEIPYTTSSLKPDQGTTASKRKTGRRGRGTPRLTKLGATGDIQGEFAASVFDMLLEGAAMNAWPGSPVAISDTGISFVAATKKISRATGSWLTDGIVPNQVFKVEGSADNDGFYVAKAVTALDITVGDTLVDEAAGASVTVKGTPLSDGETQVSFSAEQRSLDEELYLGFLGLLVNTMSLDVKPNAILGVTFDFIGKSGTPSDTSLATSVTNAADVEAFDAVDNLKAVFEGGAKVMGVTDLTAQIANNLVEGPAVGQRGNYMIGLGGVDVSGGFAKYFEDIALYQKAIDYVTSSLAWVYEDATGAGFAISLPAVKYKVNGSLSGGDPDSLVIADMTYEAFEEAVTKKTFIFSRWS